MKKFTFVLFAILVLSGCAKQFVGTSVSMTSPYVCPTPSFPAECRIEAFKELIPYFNITKQGSSGIYLIEGYLDPTEGSMQSFDHIVPAKTTFKMIFINDSEVFDTEIFSSLDTSIDKKITFKFTYDSKGIEIEAVSFTYKLYVEG